MKKLTIKYWNEIHNCSLNHIKYLTDEYIIRTQLNHKTIQIFFLQKLGSDVVESARIGDFIHKTKGEIFFLTRKNCNLCAILRKSLSEKKGDIK